MLTPHCVLVYWCNLTDIIDCGYPVQFPQYFISEPCVIFISVDSVTSTLDPFWWLNAQNGKPSSICWLWHEFLLYLQAYSLASCISCINAHRPSVDSHNIYIKIQWIWMVWIGKIQLLNLETTYLCVCVEVWFVQFVVLKVRGVLLKACFTYISYTARVRGLGGLPQSLCIHQRCRASAFFSNCLFRMRNYARSSLKKYDGNRIDFCCNTWMPVFIENSIMKLVLVNSAWHFRNKWSDYLANN